MIGVPVRDTQSRDTQKKSRLCDNEESDWTDVTTGQGAPWATISWERQWMDSFLEPLEEMWWDVTSTIRLIYMAKVNGFSRCSFKIVDF